MPYKKRCDSCKTQQNVQSDSKIFKLNQQVEIPRQNGKVIEGFYAITSERETPSVAHDDGLKYSRCFKLTESYEVAITCKDAYLVKLDFPNSESLNNVQASYITESKKLAAMYFLIFPFPVILLFILIVLNSIPLQFRHKSKLKYIIGFLAFIGIVSLVTLTHNPFFGIGIVSLIYYFILGLTLVLKKLKQFIKKN